MNMRRCAIVAGLSLFGATAVAQDVKVDFDKDANFTAYKTFATKIGTSWNNPIGEKRVAAEIEQRAHREGLDGRTDEAADAIVAAPRRDREAEEAEHVLHRRRLRRLRMARQGRRDGHAPPPPPSEYTVGTLVVDIFDAKSKQLMFRGTAQDELSDKPEKNVKKLAKASDKLFKDFPPGSKK